jgi:large subunit ribosomal protein L10
MLKTVKEENISALKLDLAKAQSLVLADFRGISVKSDTTLRREFRLSGCRYQVVKNTLLGIAVKGTPLEGIEKLLAGPTAIAYSFEDPAAPAKIASKVAKGEEKFVIKGGYVEGRALDAKGVEALSKLPTKDELRSSFLALLVAAPQNFLALLAAAPQQMVGVLAARERALSEGGGK